MTETYVRTRVSPLMQSMIDGVRAHAQAHYEEGWDVVVEAYDDAQLIAEIGYCRSVESAVKAVAKGLDLHASVRHDVRAAGGIDEEVPLPVPTDVDDELKLTGALARFVEDDAAAQAAVEQEQSGDDGAQVVQLGSRTRKPRQPRQPRTRKAKSE